MDVFGPADDHGLSREVADGVFAVNAHFWGFPNLVYFLRSGDSWALIDTGVADTPPVAIIPFLERHGGIRRLELVMGTHGHLDHIGGNGIIKQLAPHTRFALGRPDCRWAESAEHHYVELYACGSPDGWRPDSGTERMVRAGIGDPVAIDHPLSGGEELRFGDGRTIVTTHLGGHSPGQTLYTDAATGTAFTGDAVQAAGIMNEHTGRRDFPMYRTPADYVRSLATIAQTGATRLCTAHAGVHEGNAAAELLAAAGDWSRDFAGLLSTKAKALGSFSLGQMVSAVLGEMTEYADALQIRVTTAEHLDDLVADGVLAPRMANGVKTWALSSAGI